MSDETNFSGFSRETIEFLIQLGFNNSKPWFQEHKSEYENFLLQPLRDLVTDLTECMLSIDQQLEVRPAVNKTISRIYRDTRFSKDKSVYRNYMWIKFKRPIIDWEDAPAYFFDISPEGYRYGMGLYNPKPETMRRFRKMLDENSAGFKSVIEFFHDDSELRLGGDMYKRKFANELPDELDTWYQRKNLYVMAGRELDEQLFSRELVGYLREGFKNLAPLYDYLWKLK